MVGMGSLQMKGTTRCRSSMCQNRRRHRLSRRFRLDEIRFRSPRVVTLRTLRTLAKIRFRFLIFPIRSSRCLRVWRMFRLRRPKLWFRVDTPMSRIRLVEASQPSIFRILRFPLLRRRLLPRTRSVWRLKGVLPIPPTARGRSRYWMPQTRAS